MSRLARARIALISSQWYMHAAVDMAQRMDAHRTNVDLHVAGVAIVNHRKELANDSTLNK